ncbi:hypothetical protein I601_1892 [Nocardioides dokdonensis FR1436]|uniref:Uncharacterized protein n=1 Tax=Nocardioides dokdonensis FR1436 TaxID=1300347 RepID=A0A1A9GKZ1_9ACTN|nr:hypothetical protein [Nocardioides dokdonensis]ANH38322.1 hypothetical protein I601_1892 [Nocardioides dokdonensis FR1436]
MTAPIPEERDASPLDTAGKPPGEHDTELPGDDSERPADPAPAEHERNAETSEDQPSQ